MHKTVRFAWGRAMAAFMVAALLVVGSSGLAAADMRIVSESEGIRSETLFTTDRIAGSMGDGSKMLYFCERDEIAVISPANVGRYWQGTFQDIQATFAELFAFDAAEEGTEGEMGELEALGALFGSLFGDEDGEEETLVRVSLAGEETIAGYAAEHYVVETGSGDNWRVHEELWIAPELLGQMRSEVGRCVDMLLQLQDELLPEVVSGLEQVDEVLASPEYQALFERGYPVRTKSIMNFFGMEFETIDEVVEVSRDVIPAAEFAIPAGYVRVDNFLEVMSFE